MPTLPIAPASLHLLRLRLESEGVDPAGILTPAGAATGHALAARWTGFVRDRAGLEDAAHLDARWFGPLLQEFLAADGWGDVVTSDLAGTAVLLESRNAAEADPDSATAPGCHFTAGMLAALLGDIAGESLAFLEVSCRSAGDDACAFLVSSAEVIAAASDLLAAGGSWREAVDPLVRG